MIENRPIEPKHTVRFRWLFLLAVIPILGALPIQMEQSRNRAMASVDLSVQDQFEPPYVPEYNSINHIVDELEFDILIDLNNAGSNPEIQTDLDAATPPEDEDQASQDPYMPIILAAASQYKVDPTIIQAIIMAESGYNPKAVSKRGAKGLMQLMPRTARSLGVEDSFNPEQNIHAGVKYFSQLLNKFDGDHALALAAYNAGSRKVRKYRGVPPFKATKHYIKKVLKYQRIFKEEMVSNG